VAEKVNPTPYCYYADVVSVYDADTITVNLDYGFGLWHSLMKIRLARINAYEVRLNKKKGITAAHKKQGLKGKAFVKDAIEGKRIMVRTAFKGKTRGKFGRVLGEIYVQNLFANNGKWSNLNDELVKLGHAKYQRY